MALFLKHGKVYDENGRVQEQVPEWVWEEAMRCSAQALQQAGFDPGNVQKLNNQVEPPEEPEEPEAPAEQREPEEPAPAQSRGRIRTRQTA